MTLRWRYAIHTKGVGSGSLEKSGSVATVEEIAEIARSNSEKKIAIYAPLDEDRRKDHTRKTRCRAHVSANLKEDKVGQWDGGQHVSDSSIGGLAEDRRPERRRRNRSHV